MSSVIVESESVVSACKNKVMSTPLDPYFRRCIVSLWNKGENISSIVREGQETTQKTLRMMHSPTDVPQFIPWNSKIHLHC